MLPHEEILEIGKFLLDLFKQLIALDTAMLAAIVTIVEKVFTTKRVFKSPCGKGFFWGSLFSFVFSLILSVLALPEVINNLTGMLQGTVMDKWVSNLSFYGSTGFFLLGIVSFLGLAVWSFFSGPTRDSQTAPRKTTPSPAK